MRPRTPPAALVAVSVAVCPSDRSLLGRSFVAVGVSSATVAVRRYAHGCTTGRGADPLMRNSPMITSGFPPAPMKRSLEGKGDLGQMLAVLWLARLIPDRPVVSEGGQPAMAGALLTFSGSPPAAFMDDAARRRSSGRPAERDSHWRARDPCVMVSRGHDPADTRAMVRGGTRCTTCQQAPGSGPPGGTPRRTSEQ